MSARRRKQIESKPVWRSRTQRPPSPLFAFVVSLVVHVLIVLALYRAYSEFVGPPMPAIRIVANDTRPRLRTTPTFAVSPWPEVPATDDQPRAVAPPTTLPRQATTVAGATVRPIPIQSQTSKRALVGASLPTAPVELPAVAELEPEIATTIPAITPPIDRIERLNSSPIASERIASLPTYAAKSQRKLGLARVPDAGLSETETAEPVRRPANAFAHRGENAQTPRENRPAIDRGLEFLARMQQDDGRWHFADLPSGSNSSHQVASIRSDTAATGLALLAFLGAGHDHYDGRYRLVVRDGIDFLLQVQQDGGKFFPDDGLPTGQLTRFYSHGIATLALSEAFGMTGDERLSTPAQRALDYLVSKQNPQRGGWRSLPGADADLSTIGWQLATLRSGRLAGLNVQPATLLEIGEYLEKRRGRSSLSQGDAPAGQTQPPDTVTTAVGLAVELHLGGSSADQRLRPAAEQVLAHPPEVGDSLAAVEVGTAENPQRDTYYWYFGSEAMFQLGGDDWQAWSHKLYPRLIQSQVEAGPLTGSWDPINVGREAGDDCSSRLYVTAMNLLSLEIRNRQVRVDLNKLPRIAEQPAEVPR